MPQDNSKYDEIKRKLRELKKLEMKIRSTNFDLQKNNKKSLCKFENTELVWNKFFDLKNETTKNVKYSIMELSEMTKDEFKDVISEYFYYVYYSCYKESALSDYSIIDTENLIQLGLPIYADNTEIKRKFRELAKTYHPDNGGDSAKFIEIMEKYKNLF
ncbi:J domain-containing protein [Anaerosporobacter sp.]